MWSFWASYFFRRTDNFELCQVLWLHVSADLRFRKTSRQNPLTLNVPLFSFDPVPSLGNMVEGKHIVIDFFLTTKLQRKTSEWILVPSEEIQNFTTPFRMLKNSLSGRQSLKWASWEILLGKMKDSGKRRWPMHYYCSFWHFLQLHKPCRGSSCVDMVRSWKSFPTVESEFSPSMELVVRTVIIFQNIIVAIISMFFIFAYITNICPLNKNHRIRPPKNRFLLSKRHPLAFDEVLSHRWARSGGRHPDVAGEPARGVVRNWGGSMGWSQ